MRLSLSGMSILNVPFEEFGRARAFVDLLDGRFAMNGADLLNLARASLIAAGMRARLLNRARAPCPLSGVTFKSSSRSPRSGRIRASIPRAVPTN